LEGHTVLRKQSRQRRIIVVQGRLGGQLNKLIIKISEGACPRRLRYVSGDRRLQVAIGIGSTKNQYGQDEGGKGQTALNP
jgi:hypothetical protein